MKCRGKKIVSVLLVLVMVISLLPDIFVVGVGASTSEDWEYIYCTGNNIRIIHYNGDETSVTVPSEIDGRTVTEIEDSAFENNKNLTNIVLPKSIVYIGDRAFSRCSSLLSVSIPNGVTYIGDSAFSGCSSLLSLSIPNGVTYIGDWVFAYCFNLISVTIPESVTSIKMTEIWGYSSFYLCRNLKSINVDSKNQVFSSEDGVLYNKNKSDLLLYPQGKSGNSFTVPNGVEYFMANAFLNCTQLKSITIPNSVKSIGRSIFSGCSGLAGITIPNSVTYIGASAFSGCTGLSNITIPNSVTYIGVSAFSGCTGLSNITIPNSVASIGAGAFYNCNSLTEVKIPKSVTEMGKKTFYNCTNLRMVKFMGKKPNALAEGPWERNPTFNGNIFQNTHKNFIIYYPKWYEKSWRDYKYYPKLPHYEGGITVEKIKINKRKRNIIKNKKYQLKQTVAPINATNKDVIWISSNPKVATVSQKGIVKAKRKGKCKISVITEDGNKRASCQISVVIPVIKVKINKKKITIEKGKKYILKQKVMPQNATTKRVLWRSSNKKVATVSKSGVIKARKRGKCTITVITKDRNKKAKCRITVQ